MFRNSSLRLMESRKKTKKYNDEEESSESEAPKSPETVQRSSSFATERKRNSEGSTPATAGASVKRRNTKKQIGVKKAFSTLRRTNSRRNERQDSDDLPTEQKKLASLEDMHHSSDGEADKVGIPVQSSISTGTLHNVSSLRQNLGSRIGSVKRRSLNSRSQYATSNKQIADDILRDVKNLNDIGEAFTLLLVPSRFSVSSKVNEGTAKGNANLAQKQQIIASLTFVIDEIGHRTKDTTSLADRGAVVAPFSQVWD